jgi:hypothetical protein
MDPKAGLSILEKEKKNLSLRGIETRFLGHASGSLLTDISS